MMIAIIFAEAILQATQHAYMYGCIHDKTIEPLDALHHACHVCTGERLVSGA